MLSLEKQNYWRDVYRQEHSGWQPATEVYAAMVRAESGPIGRLLDLGCGRGGLVEQLASDKASVFGIDPDEISLHEHRALHFPRATAFSEQLPFADESFLVVMASWLLEHLPAPAITWSEVGRVLQAGGCFIFITPNARHPLTWLNRGFGQLGRWQGQLVSRLYNRAESDTFPTAYRANTADTIAMYCAGAGMTLETLVTISDPTYLAFSPLLFRLACALDGLLPVDRHIHLVGLARKSGTKNLAADDR